MSPERPVDTTDETEDPAYWTPFVSNWTDLVRRASDDRFFVELRRELRERGVIPEEAVVAWLVPTGRRLTEGIVVSRGDIFEFVVREASAAGEQLQVLVWQSISETFERRPFAAAIEAALSLANRPT